MKRDARSIVLLLAVRVRMHPRGYTLIEMMIAMAMAVALMSTLSALVARIIMANAAAGEHLGDVTALGTVGRQLRADARASVAAAVSAPDAGSKTLTLKLRNGTAIEYKIVGAVLERSANSTTPEGPPRRETYTFSSMRAIGWKLEGNEVSLRLARLTGGHDVTPAASFDIVAVRSSEKQDELFP